jgi:ABC-type transporter Mla MlaB component
MNSIFCVAPEAIKFVPSGLTELVRGQEQRLLEPLTLLVCRQSVMLDLGRVERIDAAGIAALIRLYCDACKAGHTFRVSNATHRVREILALVGVDRVLLSHDMDCESYSSAHMEKSAA